MVRVVKVGDEFDYQYNDIENKIIDILDELYGVRDYYINPSHLMSFEYNPYKKQITMNIEVVDGRFKLSSLVVGVGNSIILNRILPVLINSYLLFVRVFDPVFRSKIGLPKHLTEKDVEDIVNSNSKSVTHFFVNKINKTGTVLFSLNDKQIVSASLDSNSINMFVLPNTLRYYTKPKRLSMFWMFIVPGLVPAVKLLGYDKDIVSDIYDAYYKRFYLGDESGSSGRCTFEKGENGGCMIECLNL